MPSKFRHEMFHTGAAVSIALTFFYNVIYCDVQTFLCGRKWLLFFPKKHSDTEISPKSGAVLPQTFTSYDIWSAFSMSYTTADPGGPPPLAMPAAQLPPFPRRRRLRAKTTVAPSAKVDEQTIPSYELRSTADSAGQSN